MNSVRDIFMSTLSSAANRREQSPDKILGYLKDNPPVKVFTTTELEWWRSSLVGLFHNPVTKNDAMKALSEISKNIRI